ncbi:hypothetical protein HDU86_000273 [Geranomyces michiganensis]|nr:hypothetical protein HDU86_000273 [Geranomyces michiganensis]
MVSAVDPDTQRNGLLVLPGTPAQKQAKTVRFDMPSSPTNSEHQQLLMGQIEDPAVILKFILQGMRRNMEGDSTLYNDIVALLCRRPPNPASIPSALLKQWLLAVSQIVSSFTPAYKALVNAVLDIPWWDLEDDQALVLYKRWLENLVSAHAVHVLPVATMLVARLRKGPSTGIPPGVHFDRVHTILQSVLALIPTGPSFLLPVITDNFPNKHEPLDVHAYFLTNVLRMADYAPVLRDHILALIIDRLVQVDAELQVDLEELDEDIWEQVQQTVRTTEVEDPNSVWQSSQQLLHAATDPNGNLESEDEDDFAFDSDDEEGLFAVAIDFKAVIEKLDAMLRLVFQWIRNFAQANPGEPLRILFDVMLNIFERTVLPTHKLRCTQFLWFYTCSLDSTFPELFMGMMVGKLFDVSAPSVIRVSAASYLGSFIARARFLSLASVRTCLRLLHNWTQSYVEKYDSTQRGQAPDPERFGVFYSAVQAILYIFCFRWRQLMMGGEEFGSGGGGGASGRYGMMPPELKDFQRVLLSRFQPLRVCSEGIVMEFTKRTHSLDILYLHTAAANVNGSTAIPSTSSSSAIPTVNGYLAVPGTHPPSHHYQHHHHGLNNTVQRLDPFFPFDPITLPVSRAYIDAIYQPWESEPATDDDDSDDELDAISTSFDGVRI